MGKVIVGFLLGFVVATGIFAAQEYGLFNHPYPISRDGLVEKMACSQFDDNAEWFVEQSRDGKALVTLQMPLKRQRFLLGIGDLNIAELPKSRARLTLRKNVFVIDLIKPAE